MESITPGEKVTTPKMTLSTRPEHTSPDHRQCAYYPNLSLDHMTCPHGEMANGAFYSEDYIYDLRTTTHELIQWIDSVSEKAVEVPTEHALVKNTIFPPLDATIWRSIRLLVNRLREMTK